mgnify:CR=1 FL=1|jgi:hypothetical protein
MPFTDPRTETKHNLSDYNEAQKITRNKKYYMDYLQGLKDYFTEFELILNVVEHYELTQEIKRIEKHITIL